MTTRNNIIELPKDLYERLQAAAQAESIDAATLIENLLILKDQESDYPAKNRPSTAPIYKVHEYAIDTGITDLAENIDYYLYGIRRDEDDK